MKNVEELQLGALENANVSFCTRDHFGRPNKNESDYYIRFAYSGINEKDIIDNPVYIVKEGDTLWDIAKKYKGISVNELIKHNNLNSNQLKPGEKIILPTG